MADAPIGKEQGTPTPPNPEGGRPGKWTVDLNSGNQITYGDGEGKPPTENRKSGPFSGVVEWFRRIGRQGQSPEKPAGGKTVLNVFEDAHAERMGANTKVTEETQTGSTPPAGQDKPKE